MSRSWNGEDLVSEFSQALGDTSDSFKARVTGWLNDIIFDINSRYDWGHKLVKGKKILDSDEEIHSLEIAPPAAPDIELVIDGELSENSKYKVLVTFVQANGIETAAGEESEEVTATNTDKTISLSNIPTSPESLVTKRNIYLKKNDGDFLFHSQINDNIMTSLEIDSETDSEVMPPDYEAIRKIDGSPYFEESPSSRLIFKPMDQLRMIAQGKWSIGSPEYFCNVSENQIALYPAPSTQLEVVFNYYRNPFVLHNSKTSSPDLPINFKAVLKAGVMALGYEYRERDGAASKKQEYEALIDDAIKRFGETANVEYSIRDVYGNYDGFEVGN